jgi:protocatechuate 3,4-dioxygenase beta subunit
MERREPVLLYLLGLVSLVGVSILSTNQIERVEIQPLPTHTSTIVITPQPTALPPETSWLDCATIPQGITFGYLPDTASLTHLAGDTLTISGIVYASDFVTPLPGVLIEVWRATPEVLTMVWGVTPESDDDFPPFILLKQVRTDAAGRYEFTTPKPDPTVSYYSYQRGSGFRPIYFHYRLSYQGNCPSSVQLLSADTTSPEYKPSASNLPRTLLFKQVKPADTMLQGPVNIALPVSPPGSSWEQTTRAK